MSHKEKSKRNHSRYTVIKHSDLNDIGRNSLYRFIKENSVPTRTAVVVEKDWPIYEWVWDMVRRMREGERQRATIRSERIRSLEAKLLELGFCTHCMEAPQHHRDEPFSSCKCGTGEDRAKAPLQRLQLLEKEKENQELKLLTDRCVDLTHKLNDVVFQRDNLLEDNKKLLDLIKGHVARVESLEDELGEANKSCIREAEKYGNLNARYHKVKELAEKLCKAYIKNPHNPKNTFINCITPEKPAIKSRIGVVDLWFSLAEALQMGYSLPQVMSPEVAAQVKKLEFMAERLRQDSANAQENGYEGAAEGMGDAADRLVEEANRLRSQP